MALNHESDGIQTYGPETAPLTQDLSVNELTTRFIDQVRRLVRDELELGKFEVTQRAKRMALGAGMFGGAGVIAFLGAACLVAGAILGLSNVTRPWFAAIVVGAACFVVAALVALPGKKGFTARHPRVPNDSIESLKADSAAVREALHHG